MQYKENKHKLSKIWKSSEYIDNTILQKDSNIVFSKQTYEKNKIIVYESDWQKINSNRSGMYNPNGNLCPIMLPYEFSVELSIPEDKIPGIDISVLVDSGDTNHDISDIQLIGETSYTLLEKIYLGTKLIVNTPQWFSTYNEVTGVEGIRVGSGYSTQAEYHKVFPAGYPVGHGWYLVNDTDMACYDGSRADPIIRFCWYVPNPPPIHGIGQPNIDFKTGWFEAKHSTLSSNEIRVEFGYPTYYTRKESHRIDFSQAENIYWKKTEDKNGKTKYTLYITGYIPQIVSVIPDPLGNIVVSKSKWYYEKYLGGGETEGDYKYTSVTRENYTKYRYNTNIVQTKVKLLLTMKNTLDHKIIKTDEIRTD